MTEKEPPPSGPPNGDSERDERGRFAKGNAGGPGNPLARQASKYRAAAMSAITPEHVAAILRRVTMRALEGDLKAARIVLDRVLGRPSEEAEEVGALPIELPELETAADCRKASKIILDAVVAGQVTRELAQVLIEAVNLRARTIETVELDLRMREMEQRVEARIGKTKARGR